MPNPKSPPQNHPLQITNQPSDIAHSPWWQSAVFYQIYPRSFADSNGDGIGDLPGIIARLDYLQDLGIDAIWLSPHYPSPQFDCGYDIVDYTAVAPEFGTLNDFKCLLDGLHQRGMRLILDLVLNHTSDKHPWFQEARRSRDNPHRDWYIWRDGKGDNPPNNWMSTFGGSAWEFDAASGQYYYHFFFKQQPDLNWRNPAVKRAMFDAVCFWLEMGVDGFRLDAIGTIFEHPDLPDHSSRLTLAELRQLLATSTSRKERRALGKEWRAMFQHQVDQPGVHELMQELRALVDEFGERLLVGETDDLSYHGNGEDELHMVFNFPLMHSKRLTPARVRANQARRLSTLANISPQAWPCNTFGNHDSSRTHNRFGDGQHDAQLARLHLALLLTLRGTPFLYNGEEIGMSDLLLSDIQQFRDMLGIWLYHAEIDELGLSPEQALQDAARLSRDKCRTPMQWANAPNAGFGPPGVETWLPVNPNYATGVNVADQEADPASLLNFYRAFLRLRKHNPALIIGDYTQLAPRSRDVLAFVRRAPHQACLVALNFAPQNSHLRLPGLPPAHLLYSNHPRAAASIPLPDLTLSPFEILIAELPDSPVT